MRSRVPSRGGATFFSIAGAFDFPSTRASKLLSNRLLTTSVKWPPAPRPRGIDMESPSGTVDRNGTAGSLQCAGAGFRRTDGAPDVTVATFGGNLRQGLGLPTREQQIAEMPT